jgi:hypothetical protein
VQSSSVALVMGLVVGLVTQPQAAAAQPPSGDSLAGATDTPGAPDAVEEARALYREGLEAIASARWAEAAQAFRASYALHANPASLFNLGTALRAVGRSVETAAALDRLFTRHGDEIDPEVRVAAQQMLDEARARIAVLELTGLELTGLELTGLESTGVDAAGGSVFVDGEPTPYRPAARVSVEVDPGEHSVRVERDGFVPFEWRGDVEAGGRRVVGVELLPMARSPDEDANRASSPWLWVAVGGAVAAAIAAAVIVIVVTSGPTVEPQSADVIRL